MLKIDFSEGVLSNFKLMPSRKWNHEPLIPHSKKIASCTVFACIVLILSTFDTFGRENLAVVTITRKRLDYLTGELDCFWVEVNIFLL